jgi:glycosyltransferase involved in cell wall biosynthesis
LISYIIPALNEEGSIGNVIDKIRAIDKDGQIIVVDSNSTDRTAEIVLSLGATLVNEDKLGYGNAYKKGFSVAKGGIIATLDADGTYPPNEIPRMLEYLDKGYDFISGERLSQSSKEAMSLQHLIGNKILNIFTRVLFMVDIRDSQSGMWLFRREIMQSILPRGAGMEFSEEIKIRAATGFCYKEIPIYYDRRMGEKKLRPWKDGITNLLFLLKLRIRSGIRTRSFRCSRSSGQSGR